jgi:hypothetical protein
MKIASARAALLLGFVIPAAAGCDAGKNSGKAPIVDDEDEAADASRSDRIAPRSDTTARIDAPSGQGRADTMGLTPLDAATDVPADASSSRSDAGTDPSSDGAVAADTGLDSAGDTAPAERVCDEMTKYCEKLNMCSSFYLQVGFGDVATCAARLKIECLDSLGAPGTGATAQAWSACFEATGQASCDQFLGIGLAACDFKGSLARGAACGTGAQCQSGYCAKREGQGCGTCQPRAAVGGACQSEEACDFGLYCNSFNNRCVKPGQVGDACNDETRICLDTLSCKNSRCAAAALEGQRCVDDFSCSFPAGLYCGAGNLCTKFRIATTGQACGLERQRPTWCAAAGQCLPNETAGTCRSVTESDGKACRTDLDCFEPATCVNRVCRLPNSASCR